MRKYKKIKRKEIIFNLDEWRAIEEKAELLSMKTVFEHFGGEKFNAPLPVEGKGSVKAIHYIQSFDPQDNVSPELAHRIAKSFARKTFGDDCQI